MFITKKCSNVNRTSSSFNKKKTNVITNEKTKKCSNVNRTSSSFNKKKTNVITNEIPQIEEDNKLKKNKKKK